MRLAGKCAGRHDKTQDRRQRRERQRLEEKLDNGETVFVSACSGHSDWFLTRSLMHLRLIESRVERDHEEQEEEEEEE